MSNNVTIEPTEFRNVRSGGVSRGVRIYDDQDQCYQNCWDAIPDDDLDVLQLVVDWADERTEAILDFIREHEKDLTIGDVEYTWDQIKHILGE
jgi:hypothetical protein